MPTTCEPEVMPRLRWLDPVQVARVRRNEAIAILLHGLYGIGVDILDVEGIQVHILTVDRIGAAPKGADLVSLDERFAVFGGSGFHGRYNEVKATE